MHEGRAGEAARLTGIIDLWPPQSRAFPRHPALSWFPLGYTLRADYARAKTSSGRFARAQDCLSMGCIQEETPSAINLLLLPPLGFPLPCHLYRRLLMPPLRCQALSFFSSLPFCSLSESLLLVATFVFLTFLLFSCYLVFAIWYLLNSTVVSSGSVVAGEHPIPWQMRSKGST